MRADSASHLVRHPISFELFLLLYLVCALLLQKVNIYKTVSVIIKWSLNRMFHYTLDQIYHMLYCWYILKHTQCIIKVVEVSECKRKQNYLTKV